MARNFCCSAFGVPPRRSEVRYRQDALLAATFAPEEAITKFSLRRATVSCCSGRGANCHPSESLFEKPKPKDQQVVQPGFASFSPDGQWLFIIPPTLASAANAETRRARPASAEGTRRSAGSGHEAMQNCRSGDGRCRIGHTSLRAKTWRFSDFEVPASILPGLTSQIGLSLSMRAARTRPNVPFSRSGGTLLRTRSIDRSDSMI